MDCSRLGPTACSQFSRPRKQRHQARGDSEDFAIAPASYLIRLDIGRDKS